MIRSTINSLSIDTSKYTMSIARYMRTIQQQSQGLLDDIIDATNIDDAAFEQMLSKYDDSAQSIVLSEDGGGYEFVNVKSLLRSIHEGSLGDDDLEPLAKAQYWVEQVAQSTVNLDDICSALEDIAIGSYDQVEATISERLRNISAKFSATSGVISTERAQLRQSVLDIYTKAKGSVRSLTDGLLNLLGVAKAIEASTQQSFSNIFDADLAQFSGASVWSCMVQSFGSGINAFCNVMQAVGTAIKNTLSSLISGAIDSWEFIKGVLTGENDVFHSSNTGTPYFREIFFSVESSETTTLPPETADWGYFSDVPYTGCLLAGSALRDDYWYWTLTQKGDSPAHNRYRLRCDSHYRLVDPDLIPILVRYDDQDDGGVTRYINSAGVKLVPDGVSNLYPTRGNTYKEWLTNIATVITRSEGYTPQTEAQLLSSLQASRIIDAWLETILSQVSWTATIDDAFNPNEWYEEVANYMTSLSYGDPSECVWDFSYDNSISAVTNGDIAIRLANTSFARVSAGTKSVATFDIRNMQDQQQRFGSIISYAYHVNGRMRYVGDEKYEGFYPMYILSDYKKQPSLKLITDSVKAMVSAALVTGGLMVAGVAIVSVIGMKVRKKMRQNEWSMQAAQRNLTQALISNDKTVRNAAYGAINKYRWKSTILGVISKCLGTSAATAAASVAIQNGVESLQSAYASNASADNGPSMSDLLEAINNVRYLISGTR